MSRILLTAVMTSIGFHPAALAQQIAVQQPVVETFSVGTTVSVPDRGSMFLGGVNSAVSGRSSYGPLRTNSALGWSRSASSATAHVFIHDLAAMDEAVLAAAGRSGESRLDSRIVDRLQRRGGSPTPWKSVVDHQRISAEAERLAQQAESRGKAAVAKLHWERAARHGSALAKSRLTARTDAAAKRQ